MRGYVWLIVSAGIAQSFYLTHMQNGKYEAILATGSTLERIEPSDSVTLR
jgi:hypothetical protein